MRILVVTYSSNLNGGANRSLLMVLKNLANMYSHDIHVIVPSNGELCSELDKINISWEIHKYQPIGMIKGLSIKEIGRFFKHRINMWLNEYEANRQYKKMLTYNYDLVYLNNNGSVYGAILAQKMHLPYVWHFRGEIYENARYLEPVAKLIYDCNRLIAISHDMKSLYLKNCVLNQVDIDVVYNGIDTEKNIEHKQNQINSLELVEVGRIAKEKCQFDAIRAVELLTKDYPDIRLHIVGEGYGIDGRSYEKFIRSYVKEKKLEKHIIFEGYRKDISVLRSRMNCELICSLREPFGRVTVEAMRSGLVVIGANTGGTTEIIKDGENGLLFEQGNSQDLANKIKIICEDSEFALRLSNNAIEYSNKHFLPEENVKQINSIFDAIMEEKNG